MNDVHTAAGALVPPMLVIRPRKGWAALRLHELWEYRELLWFLTWRDIKVRYKQTVFGAAWAIIQPVMSMVVFTVFFGRLAAIPSDGVPYPLFSFSGLVPWTFFAGALTASSNSLVGSAGLLSKVYFPRLVIPVASVLVGVVDFLLAFAVLVAMILGYGFIPSWHVVWLPFLLLLAVMTALGVGFWLSALNVQFRDVRYAIPFMVQLWMFATPIVYPSSLLKEPWRTLYGLNPMTGVVEGFRWALVGTNTPPGAMLAVSVVVATIVFVFGAYYFKAMEKTFADLV